MLTNIQLNLEYGYFDHQSQKLIFVPINYVQKTGTIIQYINGYPVWKIFWNKQYRNVREYVSIAGYNNMFVLGGSRAAWNKAQQTSKTTLKTALQTATLVASNNPSTIGKSRKTPIAKPLTPALVQQLLNGTGCSISVPSVNNGVKRQRGPAVNPTPFKQLVDQKVATLRRILWWYPTTKGNAQAGEDEVDLWLAAQPALVTYKKSTRRKNYQYKLVTF